MHVRLAVCEAQVGKPESFGFAAHEPAHVVGSVKEASGASKTRILGNPKVPELGGMEYGRSFLGRLESGQRPICSPTLETNSFVSEVQKSISGSVLWRVARFVIGRYYCRQQ